MEADHENTRPYQDGPLPDTCKSGGTDQELSFFSVIAILCLDPCCGEGDALAGLVAGTSAITYGVELDHQRAEESKSRLHHVLRCGIEETRIQHRSCSLLLLNPPYDELTLEEEANAKTERQERAFLRMTVPYLIPGGVLVYIIPQNRLDKAIARLLASRFEHIHVLRFPDPEYADFRQIVVFGVRKSRQYT